MKPMRHGFHAKKLQADMDLTIHAAGDCGWHCVVLLHHMMGRRFMPRAKPKVALTHQDTEAVEDEEVELGAILDS